MKKKLLVTLCTVAALSVSACGSSSKNDVESTKATVSKNEEVKQTENTDAETIEATTEKETVEETTEATFSESDVAAIEVKSKDLHDGVWDTKITNTEKGSNVSPQLSWEAVEGADSYVVYMVDNTAGSWMHWKSKDVKKTKLKQGWADSEEYVGPYPPGGTHEYEIYVIALKNPVSEVYGEFDKSNIGFRDNKFNCNITDDGEEGNILAIGTIKGTYTAGD